MVEKRHRKFKLLESELIEPEFLGDENTKTLLVGWGSMHSQLSEAVEILNQDTEKGYGALVFGDIWPLPRKAIEKKAAEVHRIINVEQNHTGQLAGIIREMTGITPDDSILRFDGRPLSAQQIANRLKEIENGQ
jgi:2-oxoglutarate ferredoxin oxidoreductase subunit alpha